MNAPLIVHHVQAHQYYSPNYVPKSEAESKRMTASNFYRCNNDFSILQYLTRKNSCEKLDNDLINQLDLLVEEVNVPEEDYLHYQNDRPGSTGSFDKNGDISKQKLKEYEKKLQKTQSVVWSSILSFTPEYSDAFVNNKQKAYQMISDTINKFFEKCGLEPNNMEWTAAYHTNTDNRHCHILFWEKEKTKIDSHGKLCFSKWKLPKKALEEYKSDIAYYHRSEPLKYLFQRDVIRSSVTSLLKNDKSTILIEMAKNITNINSYQYARLSKENRMKLNHYIDLIVKSNKQLNSTWEMYYNNLYNTQRAILKNCIENNVVPSPEQKNFMSSRIKELYNRCGNSILKELKEYNLLSEDLHKKKTKIKNEPKKKLANNNRIIRQTNAINRSKKGFIGNIMSSIIIILSEDVSRQNDILNHWNIDEVQEENERRYMSEKDWKD